MNALRVGHQEEIKASVHAALGVLAGVCAIYNVCALVDRDDFEPHLLLNALIYAGLTALEAQRVLEHWRARDRT